MKILLIATNRHGRLMSRMDAHPLPIGLAYVAGHLDPERHTVKVMDLMFADDYLAEVAATVNQFQPDLVGVSLRNLDNNSYIDNQWALPTTKEVISLVRKNSPATIVCGGPAFSILPKECFSFVEPDLGIAGDGGETFAELADRLDSGQPYHDITGLVYKKDGEIVLNGGRCASTFGKPPRFEDLEMDKYRQAGFGIGVLTKLTSFNYIGAGKGDNGDHEEESAWRVFRPIEEVVKEVKDMEQRFDIKKVFFIDNGFNIPMDHAKSFCKALIDADLGVHWNTCLSPQDCDLELVQLMKKAGCALVLMTGLGGDSDEGVPLGENLERLRQVCQTCEEGDLHYSISQSFGDPGETAESVEEKLDFLRSIKPALANLRVGVRMLPGSDIAAQAVEDGLISDESDLIKPTFYVEESVKGWIVDHLQAEASKNPRWNVF